MSPVHVVIGLLTDRPEAVPVVAGWLHREWLGDLGLSWRDVADKLGERLNRDRLPLSLLASVGSEPVGTASLVDEEAPDGTGTVCCLTGVYVCPAWRGRGIGTRLCRHAVRLARNLKLRRLGLFTQDRERFYRRLGWRSVATTLIDGSSPVRAAAFMELAISRVKSPVPCIRTSRS